MMENWHVQIDSDMVLQPGSGVAFQKIGRKLPGQCTWHSGLVAGGGWKPWWKLGDLLPSISSFENGHENSGFSPFIVERSTIFNGKINYKMAIDIVDLPIRNGEVP